MSITKSKFGILYLLTGIIGVALIIMTYLMPMWWVALQSHQYPKSMYPKGIRYTSNMTGLQRMWRRPRTRRAWPIGWPAPTCFDRDEPKSTTLSGWFPLGQGGKRYSMNWGNHVALFPCMPGDKIPPEENSRPLKTPENMRKAKTI